MAPHYNNYYNMDYKKNIEIYQNTQKICKEICFPLENPIKYSHMSSHFTSDSILNKFVSPNYKPLIFVDNIDSFDMARNMTNSTGRILVLNLASFIRSGGGVERGCKAQEEDLYRKSNYFQANNNSFYPLEKRDVVYSPSVFIIKDSKYNLLDMPVQVSCLAVAALKNPPLLKFPSTKTYYKNTRDKNMMREKIDMIFKVAILHKHTDLVLGALGCGVYNNPKEEVALMFKKSILKYGKYFKRIGFAILSSGQNSNYNVFKKILDPLNEKF